MLRYLADDTTLFAVWECIVVSQSNFILVTCGLVLDSAIILKKLNLGDFPFCGATHTCFGLLVFSKKLDLIKLGRFF